MAANLNSALPSLHKMEAQSPVLAEALGFMQRPFGCPDDVKAKIAGLRVPAEEVSGTRFTTNWRSGPPTQDARTGGGGGHRGWGGAGGGGGGGGGRHHGHGHGHGHGAAPPPRSFHTGGPRRPVQDAPRFGNRGRKDVTTEERMLDRIRDKMNKFSELTYDATKSWLGQLLDSGEFEFLTEFITLVFDKAAAEPPFCSLYARLVAELRAGFPHINTDIQRIFDEFMGVFAEVAVEPESMGSVEYDAYVALRERQKYRRGYAAFLGAMAQRGTLTADDITRTCNVILDKLMAAKVVEHNGHLCEEYAECLKTLMLSCEALLKPVAAPLVARVKEVMVRAGSPSLTNNTRFSLMDITDAF